MTPAVVRASRQCAGTVGCVRTQSAGVPQPSRRRACSPPGRSAARHRGPPHPPPRIGARARATSSRGRTTLPAVTRRPRTRCVTSPAADGVNPSGRAASSVGRAAARDEPPRRAPLPERPGVIQRRPAADHAAARLDVRAQVEQQVDRLDVVGTRRPVQRRLVVCGPPRTARSRRRPPRPAPEQLERAFGSLPGQSTTMCRSVRQPSGRALASDGSAASAARRRPASSRSSAPK